MNEPRRKDALEREAVAYIQLGTLVQRERSAEKSELVAQVLAAPVSAEEKIRRIQRIDAQAEGAEALAPPPRPRPEGGQGGPAGAGATGPAAPRGTAGAEPGAAGLRSPEEGPHLPRPPLSRSKETVVAAARRRARRKADPAAGSFLGYLFREGLEIRAKAKGNAFIKAGLLKVTLKSEALRSFLDQAKKGLIPALGPALDLALKEGWRFLRKRDYNLLAALRRLVADLGALRLQPEAAGAGRGYAPTSRSLFGVEIAFLTFVGFRGELGPRRDRLFGLEEVLAKLSYPAKAAEEALAAGHALLRNGGPPPCLQDLILAVNMVRSQRHLSLAELLRPEAEELVSTSEFDCSEEVQADIDAHVEALLARLEELSAAGEETLRLRAFVRRTEEGEVDFGPLATFYEDSPTKKRSWEAEADNAIGLASGLGEGIVAALTPLLGAPVAGAAAPGAAVPGAPATGAAARGAAGRTEAGQAAAKTGLADPTLDYELSRLKTSLAKMARARDALPNLAWNRFLALRAKAVQATSFEAEGFGLVVEAADEFYRIGVRLAALLRLRETPPAGAGQTAEAEPSLEDLGLRLGFSTLSSVCFLAALRFQEPTLATTLKNERQVEDQRRALLEEFERIAGAPLYREARGLRAPESEAPEL